MAPDWARLCRGEGFAIEGDDIQVMLAAGRHQRVSVADRGTSYELHSIVARPAVVNAIADAPLRAWRRNRSALLVGFRIDKRRRLVGQAWVPKAGLTAAEFQMYVRRVAVESDRFEYLLTGADNE
jgi:hypothetical protein